jgi:hypothetical protein
MGEDANGGGVMVRVAVMLLLASLTACGDYQQAAPVDAVEISDNGAN